ncbi:MAG: hypothetical protein FIA82_07745 [Melioribacter sp.]|nr:hypothetical protein [Melioribacter sp.]
MKYNTFEEYFSLPRLQKFINHYSGDKIRALLLYKANLRLSQAFYPLLSILEISLRNAIDLHFAVVFSDQDWLMNQTTGFMSDPSLGYSSNPFLLRENIKRIKIKLGYSLTQGKLISELTFGSWTEFFEKKHYRVLKGGAIKIFPNLPSHIKRNNVYDKLNRIRYFRNRVYHYEPICFNDGNFELTRTENIYKEILEILDWFDKDLVEWITPIDFVQYEISRIKFIESKKFFSIFMLRLKYIFAKIFYLFRQKANKLNIIFSCIIKHLGIIMYDLVFNFMDCRKKI